MSCFRAQHFPALDGLRGLAILLVITHHQLIPFSLRGGFLGVDLFFVLSGFLITTLLLREFDKTESISLTNFYIRRVLRLAPALLLYLIASLIVTHYLHPEAITQQLKLIALALGYLTNWRMALGWDYSLDPTAIIWSLSIEEQFYLLWPPVLLLLLSTRIKPKYIVGALAFIIAGIGLHRAMLWTQGAEFNRMYYGTDARADAPLVGCLVAMLPLGHFSKRLKLTLNIGALVAGCLLVFLIFRSTFVDPFLYCGGYTFIALAAGLVTWNISAYPDGPLGSALNWFPLRWFGLISYGLYLWHWLLLQSTSFYYFVGKWDPWMRCAVAVLVAAASFYLVERRFTRLKTRFSYSTSHQNSSDRSVPAFIGPVIQTSKQQI